MRRALDVREQERHCPRGEIPWHAASIVDDSVPDALPVAGAGWRLANVPQTNHSDATASAGTRHRDRPASARRDGRPRHLTNQATSRCRPRRRTRSLADGRSTGRARPIRSDTRAPTRIGSVGGLASTRPDRRRVAAHAFDVAERPHGISMSLTSIGTVRRATNRGSIASAAAASLACTRHQIACPPARQVDAAEPCRSGLRKPVQAAKAAEHSAGVCRCSRRKNGMRSSCLARRRGTSGTPP